MRILVTGATGLLGNSILRQLWSSTDHDPVVLVRQEPDPVVFDESEADAAPSDRSLEIVRQAFASESPISDESELQDALNDCVAAVDAVIHCAAKIHLGWRKMDESMAINRDGTRRLAKACLRTNKKLVHIGTVNSIALGSKSTPADESTSFDHAGGQVGCSYVESKRAANREVLSAVKQGLDAVILHPGFMLGPWDWKPSSGRMLLELGKGWKPIAPRGGCSVCDARDVAKAVVSAVDRPIEPGRQFILAGHNWTYRRLWTEMAARMGTRPPVRSLGPGVEYLAGLFGDLWTRCSGRENDLNSAQIAMSGQFHWYNSRRAIRELGYEIRPAEETLDDAIAWILNRFDLPPSERDC